MSERDRAAALAELQDVFRLAKNNGALHFQALEAVAIHVLRDPHRYRTAFGVPYPDAPSTIVYRLPAYATLTSDASRDIVDRVTRSQGCLGPVDTEDARAIAARAATGLVGDGEE